MKLKILFVLVILLLSMVYSACIAPHIIPDISRTISPDVSFDVGTEKLMGKTGIFNPLSGSYYDGNVWVIYIGSKIITNGFNTDTVGGETGELNYVALFDEYDNVLVKTNNDYNDVENNYLDDGQPSYCAIEDFLCYTPGNADGSCTDSNNYIGFGIDESIEKVFDGNDFGLHKFSVKLGLIAMAEAPEGADNYYIDFYSPKNILKNIRTGITDSQNSDTRHFSVSSPAAIMFSGAPESKLLKSNGKSETLTENNKYIIKNTSAFDFEVKDYRLNCSTGANCTLQVGPDGKLLYSGFKIPAGKSIVIPVDIDFNTNSLPLSRVTVSMDLNYTIFGKDSCIEQGVPCTKNSGNTNYDIGLIDQQDFQIKIKNKPEGSVVLYDECISSDGVPGKTGEKIVPKINLAMGGTDGNEVDMFECDLEKINPLDNTLVDNNYVYCTQGEFLIELAKKIDKIFTLETNGDINNVEPYYSNFTANLVEQDFNLDTINSTINGFTTYQILQKGHFSNTDAFSTANPGELEEMLKNLMKGISFDKQTPVGTDTISAGKYQVEISLTNNRADGRGLFGLDSTGVFDEPYELNPYVKISVSLQKIGEPEYDWFFYTKEYNGLIQEVSLDNYNSNITKRGLVLEFTNDGPDAKINLYNNFASPIFIGVPNGVPPFTSLMEVTEGQNSPYPFQGKDKFTYWTGFASTKGDGCESIRTTDKALPYNEPDVPSGITSTNEYAEFSFKLNGISNYYDSMYLQSVLYLNKPIKILTQNYIYAADEGTFCGCYESQSGPGAGIVRCVQFNSGVTGTLLSGNKCNITIPESNEYSLLDSDLPKLFEQIKSGNVCVSKQTKRVSGEGIDTWKLFWNEGKIIRKLNDMKSLINTNQTIRAQGKDANLCNLRNPPELFEIN